MGSKAEGTWGLYLKMDEKMKIYGDDRLFLFHVMETVLRFETDRDSSFFLKADHLLWRMENETEYFEADYSELNPEEIALAKKALKRYDELKTEIAVGIVELRKEFLNVEPS